MAPQESARGVRPIQKLTMRFSKVDTTITHRPLVFILLIIFLAACTKTAEIQPSEYQHADTNRDGFWRVTTIGGDTYSVTRFKINDTELVILETSEMSKPGSSNSRYTEIEDAELPLIVRLVEVSKLEQVKVSKLKSTIAVVGLAAVAAAGLVAYAVTHAE